jgi:hypothetical protein
MGLHRGAHGARMMWTTDKPTVPGWYWWRRTVARQPAKVYVLEFIESHNGLHNSRWGSVMVLDGEWAGPINQPEEPA